MVIFTSRLQSVRFLSRKPWKHVMSLSNTYRALRKIPTCPKFHSCNMIFVSYSIFVGTTCVRFFTQPSIMKLCDLSKFHIFLLLYLVSKTKSPKYLFDRILYVSDIGVRGTRRGWVALLPVSLLFIYRYYYLCCSCCAGFYNKSFTATA